MMYNTIFLDAFIQTKIIIHKTKLNKGRNMMEHKEKAMLVGQSPEVITMI